MTGLNPGMKSTETSNLNFNSYSVTVNVNETVNSQKNDRMIIVKKEKPKTAKPVKPKEESFESAEKVYKKSAIKQREYSTDLRKTNSVKSSSRDGFDSLGKRTINSENEDRPVRVEMFQGNISRPTNKKSDSNINVNESSQQQYSYKVKESINSVNKLSKIERMKMVQVPKPKPKQIKEESIYEVKIVTQDEKIENIERLVKNYEEGIIRDVQKEVIGKSKQVNNQIQKKLKYISEKNMLDNIDFNEEISEEEEKVDMEGNESGQEGEVNNTKSNYENNNIIVEQDTGFNRNRFLRREVTETRSKSQPHIVAPKKPKVNIFELEELIKNERKKIEIPDNMQDRGENSFRKSTSVHNKSTPQYNLNDSRIVKADADENIYLHGGVKRDRNDIHMFIQYKRQQDKENAIRAERELLDLNIKKLTELAKVNEIQRMLVEQSANNYRASRKYRAKSDHNTKLVRNTFYIGKRGYVINNEEDRENYYNDWLEKHKLFKQRSNKPIGPRPKWKNIIEVKDKKRGRLIKTTNDLAKYTKSIKNPNKFVYLSDKQVIKSQTKEAFLKFLDDVKHTTLRSLDSHDILSVKSDKKNANSQMEIVKSESLKFEPGSRASIGSRGSSRERQYIEEDIKTPEPVMTDGKPNFSISERDVRLNFSNSAADFKVSGIDRRHSAESVEEKVEVYNPYNQEKVDVYNPYTEERIEQFIYVIKFVVNRFSLVTLFNHVETEELNARFEYLNRAIVTNVKAECFYQIYNYGIIMEEYNKQIAELYNEAFNNIDNIFMTNEYSAVKSAFDLLRRVPPKKKAEKKIEVVQKNEEDEIDESYSNSYSDDIIVKEKSLSQINKSNRAKSVPSVREYQSEPEIESEIEIENYNNERDSEGENYHENSNDNNYNNYEEVSNAQIEPMEEASNQTGRTTDRRYNTYIYETLSNKTNSSIIVYPNSMDSPKLSRIVELINRQRSERSEEVSQERSVIREQSQSAFEEEHSMSMSQSKKSLGESYQGQERPNFAGDQSEHSIQINYSKLSNIEQESKPLSNSIRVDQSKDSIADKRSKKHSQEEIQYEEEINISEHIETDPVLKNNLNHNVMNVEENEIDEEISENLSKNFKNSPSNKRSYNYLEYKSNKTDEDLSAEKYTGSEIDWHTLSVSKSNSNRELRLWEEKDRSGVKVNESDIIQEEISREKSKSNKNEKTEEEEEEEEQEYVFEENISEEVEYEPENEDVLKLISEEQQNPETKETILSGPQRSRNTDLKNEQVIFDENNLPAISDDKVTIESDKKKSIESEGERFFEVKKDDNYKVHNLLDDRSSIDVKLGTASIVTHNENLKESIVTTSTINFVIKDNNACDKKELNTISEIDRRLNEDLLDRIALIDTNMLADDIVEELMKDILQSEVNGNAPLIKKKLHSFREPNVSPSNSNNSIGFKLNDSNVSHSSVSSIFMKTVVEEKKETSLKLYNTEIAPILIDRIVDNISKNYNSILNNIKTPVSHKPVDVVQSLVFRDHELLKNSYKIIQPASFLNKKKMLLDFEPINQKIRSDINITSDNYYDNILNECLVDAACELLDKERMYSDLGEPLPWSTRTRVINYKYSNSELSKKALTQKINKELTGGINNKMGLITENNEMYDMDQLNQEREKRLMGNITAEVRFY
jgi:hypothetical protein